MAACDSRQTQRRQGRHVLVNNIMLWTGLKMPACCDDGKQEIQESMYLHSPAVDVHRLLALCLVLYVRRHMFFGPKRTKKEEDLSSPIWHMAVFERHHRYTRIPLQAAASMLSAARPFPLWILFSPLLWASLRGRKSKAVQSSVKISKAVNSVPKIKPKQTKTLPDKKYLDTFNKNYSTCCVYLMCFFC